MKKYKIEENFHLNSKNFYKITEWCEEGFDFYFTRYPLTDEVISYAAIHNDDSNMEFCYLRLEDEIGKPMRFYLQFGDKSLVLLDSDKVEIDKDMIYPSWWQYFEYACMTFQDTMLHEIVNFKAFKKFIDLCFKMHRRNTGEKIKIPDNLEPYWKGFVNYVLYCMADELFGIVKKNLEYIGESWEFEDLFFEKKFLFDPLREALTDKQHHLTRELFFPTKVKCTAEGKPLWDLCETIEDYMTQLKFVLF